MKTRITNLLPHPLACTHHSEAMKKKLAAHIQATGLYPPIIVRSLHKSEQFPSHNGHLQIIDGHLRAQVLKDLGYTHVDVKNFGNISDQASELLLLTLNHLKSPSSPQKRAELLKRHQQSTKHTLDQLAKFLPDSKITLQRLLALDKPQTLPPVQNLPKPFAVYLSQSQHNLLKFAMESIKKTSTVRSAAEALAILAKSHLKKK